MMANVEMLCVRIFRPAVTTWNWYNIHQMKKVVQRKVLKSELPSAARKVYLAWISELKKRYKATQIKAAVAVNSAMIEFYWNLGKDICERYAGTKKSAPYIFVPAYLREICWHEDIRGGLLRKAECRP